ncbi:MAG: HAMP domain-containing protein, partial [Elusimicrobiaceae bacterium]|nr:HAMP domain-containing protein [Elusimicrobiaceae bacterium]
MKTKKFQGLFAKAVVVLFVISMVPVVIIGYRITKINSRLLKNELLQKQQMVAERLALTVNNALLAKEQLLSEFGDLHTDFGSHDLITQPDLAYLQKRTPALFYLTVFSDKRKQIFDAGTAPQQSLQQVYDGLMNICLAGGKFISDVYYDEEGKPFIWLGEPLHRKMGQTAVTGVLAAALYLDDVVKTLLQTYPLDMDAMLVSAHGELLSYNGAPEGMNSQDTVALKQKLLVLEEQLAGKDSAEIRLENDQEVLVSVARVVQTNWLVYLVQPASVASKLFVDSLARSSVWDLVVIALVMVLFVGVVSYLVIIPITRPLARLREAAVKLREDENFVVKPADVEIPHNEIGDLARVFVDMSQTLHNRQQELINAQQDLAHMNQALEQRVEERTRELRATTDELVKAERLAAIGKMASIISHEIRNPLAVISNATRLIKTLVKPTEQKLTKQFNIIEDEIRQANSIISEVLGYARTRELILSMVEINSYLRELLLSYPLPAN